MDSTAVGILVIFAIPKAKNALDRSSIILKQLRRLCSESPIVSGELREPGEMHTCFTPSMDKISAQVLLHAKLDKGIRN